MIKKTGLATCVASALSLGLLQGAIAQESSDAAVLDTLTVVGDSKEAEQDSYKAKSSSAATVLMLKSSPITE